MCVTDHFLTDGELRQRSHLGAVHSRALGREIVYLAPDRMLMAVRVTTADDAITLAKPTPVFRVSADAGGGGSNWSATADLEKFVVVEAPHATGQRFQLLTNWLPDR